MLEVSKVTKRFGGLEALKDVDLKVNPGEIFGLIGPNGAGKTTLFDVISGVTRPTSGKVFFQGESITGIKPHRIAEKGLVRTFQATRLFMSLSVLENVQIGCHIPAKANIVADVFRVPSIKRRESEMQQRAIDIVKLAGIETIGGQIAKDLPHGNQRALGVAIALAAEPKVLCLDEPVTGMNIEETQFMMDLIRRIRGEGIAILLVEHSMRVVMSICDRIAVLNFGRKIAEDTPDKIQVNNDVVEAYLGRSEDVT